MTVAQEHGAAKDAPPAPQQEVKGGVGTLIAGIICVVFFGAISATVGNAEGWDIAGGFVVAPVLIAFTIPMLRRQSIRDGDKKLFTIFVLALLVKLVGSIVRYRVAKDVYGSNDAFAYSATGKELADQFRHGIFTGPKGGWSATGFIEGLTGLVFVLIGPTTMGGFFFFSWLGFIGLFHFYKAFSLAVPEGRKRTYAKLVFFLPSLLFWPSSIGKESWMMFCLGIAAYGAANLYTHRTFKGLGITALGLWFAALPRPHIAGLAGVAIAAAFVLRRPKKERRFLPFAKLISVAALGLVAAYFVTQANSFLQSSVNTSGGLSSALGSVAEQTSGGKSQFSAPVFTSPGRAPVAIFTVLFRPTIVEAASLQGLVAAMEGTLILVLTIWRLPWLIAAARSVRRRPYLGYCFIHVFLLIVALSAVSNFGILTRERVQLLPLYLVFFAVPKEALLGLRDRERTERRERHAPAAIGA